MALSERKEKIIKAVVDSYIDSCEPVSSADIKERHLPSLSTATIRNELATLEEMGYLDQPHTSAGRVPTAEAYKLYVEKLMPERKLTSGELEIVRKYFDHKITEIGDVLRSTAKVISEITNLTGVAYISDVRRAVIDNIKIVKLTEKSALVIIVTNLGVLKDATLSVAEDVRDEYFRSASSFITNAFSGHTIGEVCDCDELVFRITEEYKAVFDTIIEILKSYVVDEHGKVMLEGSSKLLEQPEYADVGKAKAMFRLLESEKELLPVLESNEEMGLSIKIAPEKSGDAPECAVVTATLTNNGVNIGKAGVIGPIRMDYSKIVSVLEYIEKTVSGLSDANVRNADEEGKTAGE